MQEVHLGVKILYNMEHPEKTVLQTNMNPEGLQEVLEGWFFTQFGQGKDTRPPKQKPIFTIMIGLDLSNDTFHTSSDTGNASLTCGIVQDVFGRLATLRLEPLQ